MYPGSTLTLPLPRPTSRLSPAPSTFFSTRPLFLTPSSSARVAVARESKKNKGAVTFGPICNLAIYACVLGTPRETRRHPLFHLSSSVCRLHGIDWNRVDSKSGVKNVQLWCIFVGRSAILNAPDSTFISGHLGNTR